MRGIFIRIFIFLAEEIKLFKLYVGTKGKKKQKTAGTLSIICHTTERKRKSVDGSLKNSFHDVHSNYKH